MPPKQKETEEEEQQQQLQEQPRPQPPSRQRVHKHRADFRVQLLAAHVLRCAWTEGTPVRGSRALASVPAPHRNAVFAVATESLKVLPSLRRTLAASTAITQHLRDDLEEVGDAPAERDKESLVVNVSLACVLLHDLIGRRWLDASQHAVQLLLRNQRELSTRWPEEQPAEVAADECSYLLFGRVNTLMACMEDVVAALCSDGWCEHSPPLGTAAANGEHLEPPFSATAGRVFCRDALFPEVLAFPPGAPVKRHRLVDDGSLLLQANLPNIPAPHLDPIQSKSPIHLTSTSPHPHPIPFYHILAFQPP